MTGADRSERTEIGLMHLTAIASKSARNNRDPAVATIQEFVARNLVGRSPAVRQFQRESKSNFFLSAIFWETHFSQLLAFSERCN